MQEKFFIVKWSEIVGMVDSIHFKCLVIAKTKEDAEEKIRRVKGITQELEVVECNPKDGLIYLGAE